MWKEKEFLELLKENGIDTVCFMGSGYHLKDYKVGQEFYKSYAYYGIMAKQDNPEAFKHTLAMIKSSKINLLDRYKLIKKYEYRLNPIWNFKQRYSKILIQNLRTKEIIDVTNNEFFINNELYYCIMCEPV